MAEPSSSSLDDLKRRLDACSWQIGEELGKRPVSDTRVAQYQKYADILLEQIRLASVGGGADDLLLSKEALDKVYRSIFLVLNQNGNCVGDGFFYAPGKAMTADHTLLPEQGMSQAGPRRPPDPTSLLRGKKVRRTGSCSTPGGSTVSPRRGAGGRTQHPSGRTTIIAPVLDHEELPSPEAEPDTTFEDDPEFRLARKQYALLRIHVKEARQLAATLDRLPDLFAEVIQRDKM